MSGSNIAEASWPINATSHQVFKALALLNETFTSVCNASTGRITRAMLEGMCREGGIHESANDGSEVIDILTARVSTLTAALSSGALKTYLQALGY